MNRTSAIEAKPRAPDRRKKRPATGRKPAATRTKVTVTIPTEVLEAAAGFVRAGRAPSLSAYISRALEQRVKEDQGPDEFLELLKQWDEELGPPSPEDYEWARRVLGL